jgi:3-methyladenine DNA glycosylase AlkC
MPDALKDIYDLAYLQRVADQLSRHHNGFSKQDFLKQVFDPDWEGRELKARMAHIRSCIHEVINLPYPEAVPVICNAATEFGGYEAMFFPDYVEAYGGNNWEVSLPALEWLTRFSSSEFAVRPFIISDKERMMAQMNQWAEHENYHVRRLASEGCRPRLPWAQALPDFKKDPTLVLPILDKLKSDETDYVRRSVANNLNDIAKDNPQVTIVWAQTNKGNSDHTDWIIKHGCRTLLKQAEPQTMELFGFGDAESFAIKNLTLKKGAIRIGEELEFSFLLTSDSEELGKLRVEYEIGYMKANGKHSYKVFKISEGDYMDKDKSFQRRQSFKPMTTRKHYPGEHWLTIKVNGVEKQSLSFTLLES